MSQADSFCVEKTCLSHMYDTSVCNQHMLSNQTQTKPVVLIVAILSLNSTFWFRLKLQVKTQGFEVRILTENHVFISNNIQSIYFIFLFSLQSFQLTSAFDKYRRDCRREKQNHCMTSALFCRRDVFCHFKSSKLSK